MDAGDVKITEEHGNAIRRKRFLQKIYSEWYSGISESLPQPDGPVLEVGSGAGFLKEFVPRLITSEVIECPGIDIVEDAQVLPFKDLSLRGIVMVDVLHHLSQPRLFLAEAGRCLRPGGVVIMVEPWVTSWSSFIWRWLHHEPFLPDAQEWEVPVNGRLAGANSALPWMMFQRDRKKFETEFPVLKIKSIKLIMPFRYLLSGGVSCCSFQPGWSFDVWRKFEMVLEPWMDKLAMFALICLSNERSEYEK